MVYITGDTHGDYGRFSKIKGIRKGDTLIVCGDFGFIWDGGKRENRLLKKIGKLKYNVTFIDGIHENFKLLNSYEPEIWQGGKTLHIDGNLRYLCRGQVFELDKMTFLTLGGGAPDSDDILPAEFDVKDCIPDRSVFNEAVNNLKTHGNTVDYIVSYEPPARISQSVLLNKRKRRESVNFHDVFAENINFKKWFFGKFHINKSITPKYTALFEKNVKVGGSAKKKLFGKG